MIKHRHHTEIGFVFFLTIAGLLLVACQEQSAPASSDEDHAKVDLIGCYAVTSGEPAVIKISQRTDTAESGYVMQMKEPDQTKVWDEPELLEMVSVKDAWRYFERSGLDVTQEDIAKVLARPDRMMVLAALKPAAVNFNPLLDSSHLVHIYNASNTIYQVACDDVPVDIINDSIKIAHGTMVPAPATDLEQAEANNLR